MQENSQCRFLEKLSTALNTNCINGLLVLCVALPLQPARGVWRQRPKSAGITFAGKLQPTRGAWRQSTAHCIAQGTEIVATYTRCVEAKFYSSAASFAAKVATYTRYVEAKIKMNKYRRGVAKRQGNGLWLRYSLVQIQPPPPKYKTQGETP